MRVRLRLKLQAPSQVMQRVPELDAKGGGVYCLMFRDSLPLLKRFGYFLFEKKLPFSVSDFHLLYVGATRVGLGSRLKQHFSNDMRGSSLRFTLACILEHELALEPRLIGDGKRYQLGSSEARLSEWLLRNTLVAYRAVDDPMALEKRLITELAPPLNLAHRRTHPFSKHLLGLRRNFSSRTNIPRLPAGPVRRAAFEQQLRVHSQGLSQPPNQGH